MDKSCSISKQESMISAVIIDDELRSINVLKKLLAEYCPEVNVVGIADVSADGVELIKQKKPDLVFLDIRMPGLNGFEVLDQFVDCDFSIVFTTAYDTHAVKAIKYAALDYLLKPISIEDLKNVVVRYTRSKEKLAGRLAILAEHQEYPHMKFGRIAIPSMGEYSFIDTRDVIWIQASDAYSIFHLANGQTKTASSNLKKFEELLDSATFLRIHHSHIVNIAHVKKYVKARNSNVVMSDGTVLEVSQRKKDVMQEFLHLL